MKNLILLLGLIPTLLCAQGAYPVENMRKKVKPGDNFLQYAAGAWLEANPLRADQRSNGAFVNCEDSVTKHISQIITDLLINRQKPGSTGEKLSIIYKQYSDTAQRNELGLTPLQADLRAIEQAKDKEELQAVMRRLDLRCGGTSLFNCGIFPDYLHADSNIVVIKAYSSYLHPSYYYRPKRRIRVIREAYKHYLCQLLEAAGHEPSTAEARMKLAFDIEKELTKATFLPLTDLWRSEDIEHSAHKMSREELERKYKEIAWDQIFRTSTGEMDVRQVDVRDQLAPKFACKVLKESDLAELKCWAEVQLLKNFAPILTQDLRRKFRIFSAAQIGQTAESDQWKVNANFLSNNFKKQMGQLYCEQYFKPEYKERVQVIAENICKAFRQRIEKNTWMTAETKQRALNKLDNIVWEIGYPEEWESLEKVNITKQNSLYENMANFGDFNNNFAIDKKLNKPVDRHDWGNRTPQEVNAFNQWGTNSIIIPAGILQAPFFDPSADEAINYGAIGVVIAHELTHGYDPLGCQVDSIGNAKNWWVRKDKRAYNRRTKVLRKYFGNLKCAGQKVNGYHTLNENVADNGGLHIALEAMKMAGISNTIDGQTAEQRFFLGYARLWAQRCNLKYLEYLIEFDEHSPHEVRVNGALPHIDEWYEAFGITPADSLYLPKEKRAEIW